MELLEVVNIEGIPTGEILSKDIIHNNNLLHNEICVFIINDKKQVLLQKRSENKRFGANKWALCEGHVQSKETLVEAALRELNEEVGLNIESNKLYSFNEKEVVVKDINSRITHYFYTITNFKEEEFSIQFEELSQVKWCYIEDVINLVEQRKEEMGIGVSKVKFLKKLLEM